MRRPAGHSTLAAWMARSHKQDWLVRADQRHSKLVAKADALATTVAAAVEALVLAARGPQALGPGKEDGAAAALPPRPAPVRQIKLPESILANREPYLQGDWRKEPYIPRCSLPQMNSFNMCPASERDACTSARSPTSADALATNEQMSTMCPAPDRDVCTV